MTYVCEKCGHADALCWRFPYSRGMETTYTTIYELQSYQPEIAIALLGGMSFVETVECSKTTENPIRVAVIGNYAYGLWKSGYVRRRWRQIWIVHGWKAMPMEKANHKGKQKNE